jgi:hypothetical protein
MFKDKDKTIILYKIIVFTYIIYNLAFYLYKKNNKINIYSYKLLK